MYITHIHITHYRGIRQLDLHLEHSASHGLAVFIGNNGAGKSTLLHAVRLMWKILTAPFFAGQVPQETLTARDRTIGVLDPFVRLGLQAVSELPHAEHISLAYEWTDYLAKEVVRPLVGPDALRNTLHGEALVRKPLPVLAYYGTDISYEVQPDTRVWVDPPALRTYLHALDERTHFGYFEQWYVDQQHEENSQKVALGDLSYQSVALSNVRTALTSFFQHLDVSVFGAVGIAKTPYTEAQGERMVMVIEKGGQKIPVSQLSDGERFLVHIVGDIARRAVMGGHDKTPIDAIHAPGVVLIDEIAQHLHPKWQAQVIPALQKTFPCLQFLITTHSPLVLSQVPGRCVYRIEDFQIDATPIHTEGRSTEHILYEEQGVLPRPAFSQQRLDRFYELLMTPQGLEEAEELLASFAAQFGERDPDVVAARRAYAFAKDDFE